MHQTKAFFVIRAKRGFQFRRRHSRPVDTSAGLHSDQLVLLTGFYSAKGYPEPLRRIHYFDAETEKRFVFLANHFDLDALTIAHLYKARWSVELFFNWIKQHLRIKAFYGTSENAVKTQVWIAISVYALVAIVKKELRIGRSRYEILQVLSVTLFEKIPILQAFSESASQSSEADPSNQLSLFD